MEPGVRLGWLRSVGFVWSGIAMLAGAQARAAEVEAGPYTAPGTGHVYYLLSPDEWLAAEQEAVLLGGHLATVDDDAENAWIGAALEPISGGPLWIGLADRASEDDFVWASGLPVTHLAWSPDGPQPDGAQPDDDCVASAGGLWNDVDCGASYRAVVEIAPPVRAIADLAGFVRAQAGDVHVIDFDADASGDAIEAPAAGVLAATLDLSPHVALTRGGVVTDPSPPASPVAGRSAPNAIAWSALEQSSGPSVAGVLGSGLTAIGVTNLGAESELRIYGADGGLLGARRSDADPESADFVGLVSDAPIARFELDAVAGGVVRADDLALGPVARRERVVFPQTGPSAIDPEHASPEHIVVKLREGSCTRVVAGALSFDRRCVLEREKRLLRRADLVPADVASAVVAIEREVASRGGTLQRMVEPDETLIADLRFRGEIASNEELADLDLYFSVRLDPSAEASVADGLVDALNAIPAVERAHAHAIPTVTEIDIPPTTVITPFGQPYLGPAPTGIDARFAWTLPGGRGADVRLIDVEGGWQLDHEDLPNPASIFHQSGINFALDSWPDHGAAVLGELVAVNNGFGAIGIVPDLGIGVASAVEAVSAVLNQPSFNETVALTIAATVLRPGDILLIEMGIIGPSGALTCIAPPAGPCGNCSQFGQLGLESDQANFDAIRLATANGVVVVEGAGNGSMNLDSSIYGGSFNRTVRDSGAIVVGANVGLGSLIPACWSNFGSRVDLHAWGGGVATLGYGAIQIAGNDARQWYTRSFSGTSSASPMVAGAAAAVQGVRRARGLAPLTSTQMRTLLATTGTPQTPATNPVWNLPSIIGPQPDLCRALSPLLPAGNDGDADGLASCADNCPVAANADQLDVDSDARGDVCDNCRLLANADQADGDFDGDGNLCDNCPQVQNASQIDTDWDGPGDACDNCRVNVNPQQENDDGDTHGNACDNCTQVANSDQGDADLDRRGDACDDDDDNDGDLDTNDNCPLEWEPQQIDHDADGLGDVCDNCPNDANPDQSNRDRDALGDACDPDDDNDGVDDATDNCPFVANPLQTDADGDGAGAACDLCPVPGANLAVPADNDSSNQCERFQCLAASNRVACFERNVIDPPFFQGCDRTGGFPRCVFSDPRPPVGGTCTPQQGDIGACCPPHASCIGPLTRVTDPFGDTLFDVPLEPLGIDPQDGFGVASGWLPDLDGDEIPDLAIGAPFHEENGSVFVVSGASGDPLRALDGDEPGAAFGACLATSGGTGLATGAPFAGSGDEGEFALWNAQSGESLGGFTGADAAGALGCGLGALGDLDGDSVTDFLVGRPGVSDGAASSVFVASGMSGDPLDEFMGTNEADRFGAAATGVGDVDRDGAPDFVVGAPQGSDPASGLRTGVVSLRSARGEVLANAYGLGADEGFGSAVSSADVDGDGLAELLVSAPGADGAAGADAGRVDLLSVDGTRLASIEGVASRGGFGTTASFAGDLNGDGVVDFGVGAPGERNGEHDTLGRSQLFLSVATQANEPDSDADATSDGEDNCPLVWNYDQLDADGDGVGNFCDVACSNGIDDDGDGPIDWPADRQCAWATDPNETAACGNGADDDGDGATDTADGGCRGADDESEGADCTDGIDNDGDGFADFGDQSHHDRGCASAHVSSVENPQCSNGRDDDGDGRVDFGSDPQCASEVGGSEKPRTCGLGGEPEH